MTWRRGGVSVSPPERSVYEAESTHASGHGESLITGSRIFEALDSLDLERVIWHPDRHDNW